MPSGTRPETPPKPLQVDVSEILRRTGNYTVDFKEVRGQMSAKRALEIAIAGGHAQAREPVVDAADRVGDPAVRDLARVADQFGQTQRLLGDAPELSPWTAATPHLGHLPPTLCNETGDTEPRDLVFEWVEPGDLDAEEIRRLTGELSFDTTAPTGVFNDLLASSPASAGSPPRCGSR